MNENNIIICENCYEENEETRTNCRNCGAKLYNNNKEKEEITKKTVNVQRTQEKPIENDEFLVGTNKVALIIKIIAIVGAVAGIIYGCILSDSSYTEELGIVYVVVSIISAVFVYALGEIIQKLQNIEDNTRK